MENYFNYFTEVEEHFQKARGTGFFLLTPLDWALLEAWKESGVPLDAVLRGIDRTFEKWLKRKRRGRLVNSLAYCSQEVIAAAHEQGPPREARAPAEPPFAAEEFAAHTARHSGTIRPRFPEIAAALDDLGAAALSGLALEWEEVERRLAVLEEKMLAALTTAADDEQLLAARRQMDVSLAPFRRKMSAEQIVMLEKQYLRKALLDGAGLPRLSLFHW